MSTYVLLLLAVPVGAQLFHGLFRLAFVAASLSVLVLAFIQAATVLKWLGRPIYRVPSDQNSKL
jgi:hypothetical protein